MPELNELMYCMKYDIILITESWLTANVGNGLIDPDNRFIVLRGDRSSGRGGGVCVLIKRGIAVAEVAVSNDYSELEMVAFDLLNVLPLVRIFTVYRPPSYDQKACHYVNLLLGCVEQYSCANRSNVILGDFNLPNICWSNLQCSSDYVHQTFLNFVITHGFVQLVDFPTRESNLLDIILTDDECLVTSVISDLPLGHSDHTSIVFTMSVAPVCKTVASNVGTKARYLWYKGDYSNMSHYLDSINWYAVLCDNPSADGMWNAFIDILWSAVNMFVPTNVPIPGRKHYCVKSRQLRKCAVRKRKLWHKLNKNPADSKARSDYRECVRMWRQISHKDEISREQNIVDANNLGTFYRYVNKRISNRTSINTVVENGVILTDNTDKANAFNRYFVSVGVSDNGFIPCCMNVKVNETLEFVKIEHNDVNRSIAKLKSSLSAGPDNLPPLLFKKIRRSISGPLAMLYNQLLSVGHVPHDWLRAVIVPVFKKGVAGKLENYRPISLTCVPSKILERIISQRIYDHMCTNNILHSSQHGFCKLKSTTTNLLECFNDWSITVLSKEQLAVVYIDFTKAFDVVSHPKLIARLHCYGVRGMVLRWIQQFLCGRTHVTRIDDAMSDIAELLSGVVQGSGIGPVMFLAYINELIYILEQFDIVVKMFADDVKMYLQIVNCVDVERLQCALTAMNEWAKEWQLEISVNKCCVMNIGVENCSPYLTLDNSVLPVVSHTRDLGVIVRNDLSPSTHVDDIVSKAHRRSKLILRTFVSRDVKLLVRAFITYVRPLLEYNTVVWSPNAARDIDAIEGVQRRFTKRLRGLGQYTYIERLSHLKLQSLEHRRLVTDLLWCYKIVFNVVNISADEFFSRSSCSYTRGHPYKLFKKRPVSSTRANFFSDRVINAWNALPDDVDFTSLSRFRRSMLKVDMSKFVKRF